MGLGELRFKFTHQKLNFILFKSNKLTLKKQNKKNKIRFNFGIVYTQRNTNIM